jgi:hypothetical protein
MHRLSSEFARLPLIGLSSWMLGAIVLLGCDSKSSYPPIDPDAAAQIKSGMTLAEIEAVLGPCRAATRGEIQRLHELSERMPEHVRKNALADRTVAWGNDTCWLAGFINSDDVVWAVTWQSN